MSEWPLPDHAREAQHKLESMEQDILWLEENSAASAYLTPHDLVELAKRLNKLSARIIARQALWSQLRGSIAKDGKGIRHE